MAQQALVGDIGGTNSRFGLTTPGSQDIRDIETLKNDRFGSLEEAIQTYLGDKGVSSLASAAIAVAGPVLGQEARLTNRNWAFSSASLKAATHARAFHLLNDYEALAMALPHLSGAELEQVGGNTPDPQRLKLVLGPGTGLGMAALAPLPRGGWLAIPGEVGHITLPIETQAEFDWREAMKTPGQTFTSEDAITGGGLLRMYRARATAPTLTTPEAVLQAGVSGSNADAVATLHQFIVWLGRIAGDAAMAMQAKGGVYLAGGIVPSLVAELRAGAFRQVFEDKGKLAHVMKPIPVYVIMDKFPAFKGCAAALAQE